MILCKMSLEFYLKKRMKLLKNWRPISLLNVDYKMCLKSIAYQLAKVFSSIINEDQTCSVPGRTISENLALFLDVLGHVNITDETSILDQEKALIVLIIPFYVSP